MTLRVGSLGTFVFEKGLYTYTGSALGRTQNLQTRLRRHLLRSKPKRWHIDYLLEGGRVQHVVVVENNSHLECIVNKAIRSKAKGVVAVRGFGASDCRMGCVTHLNYHPFHDVRSLSKKVLNVYSTIAKNPRCYSFNSTSGL
ncbi:MAG: GIY-YIG nuclease family protein [Candidatus Bathyarchaeia archaeon]